MAINAIVKCFSDIYPHVIIKRVKHRRANVVENQKRNICFVFECKTRKIIIIEVLNFDF